MLIGMRVGPRRFCIDCSAAIFSADTRGPLQIPSQRSPAPNWPRASPDRAREADIVVAGYHWCNSSVRPEAGGALAFIGAPRVYLIRLESDEERDSWSLTIDLALGDSPHLRRQVMTA